MMDTAKTVHITTIGCQMNVVDSSRMLRLLASEGYRETILMDDADLIILNTCAIREKAVQKVYSFLGRMPRLKKAKPNLKVVVAGCVAQQQSAALLARFPEVSLVLGTHAVNRLPRLLRETEAQGRRIADVAMSPGIDEIPLPPVSPSQTREVTGFVTIMRGCDNFCTYCVVPYVRGREISREAGAILDEIKEMVDAGVKEVTLLGQNVNSYQDSRGRTGFADLLYQVNEISGLERIRFVTSHPKDLSNDLIQAFSGLNKLCNHIHLPVQSGANPVLKRMNRKYTREAYLEKIEKLQKTAPNIAITTDLIAGFPGETEADIEETLGLMKTVRFDGLFAFAYSDRPQAAASRFADKIPMEVRYERLQAILNLQKRIAEEDHARLIDRVFQVLVEGVSKNQRKQSGPTGGVELTGRTSENRIVNFEWICDPFFSPENMKGRTIRVRIKQAFLNSLWGVVAENS